MVFKLLLGLSLSVPASAGGELLEHPYWKIAAPAAETPPPTAGITVGETLEYEIYWGIIHVGHSYLRVERAVDISSHTAWHIVSGARSGSFIRNFYNVDDRNESWMDPVTFNSYGYYRKISEGGYFFNEWVIFDNDSGKFYGKKMNRKRKVSSFEGLLEKPVNDYLSAIYRLRTLPLAPGAEIEMDVNTKKNWRLTIKAGKREKIKTDYGKKKCIRFEPMAGENGLFVAKAGKNMYVWITDDELKLPMMLKAEIFIGSVTAKLVKRTITP